MTESDTTAVTAPTSDPDAAPVEQQLQQQESKKLASGGLTLSIWPPSQRTRDAVINRLIDTLSSPSVLSKRYGTIPSDEAGDAARRIEDEAFGAANSVASSEYDGLEILQLYSKEISKRVLETVKARAPSASTVEHGVFGKPDPTVAHTAAESSDEVSSSVKT